MKHFSFGEIVKDLAKNQWGYQAESLEEAREKFAKQGTSVEGAVLLQLLRGLMAFNKTISQEKPYYEMPDENAECPEYAKAFPGIVVGTLLYSADVVDDGIRISVVVAVCEGDFVRTVTANAERYYNTSPGWASDNEFQTVEEAIAQSAKTELEYHEPRAKFCKKALQALRDKTSLDEFLEGFQEDEEGDIP